MFFNFCRIIQYHNICYCITDKARNNDSQNI